MLTFLAVLLIVLAAALGAIALARLLDDDSRRNRHPHHPPQTTGAREPDEGRAKGRDEQVLVAMLASGEQVALELDECYDDYQEMLEDLVGEVGSFVAAEGGRYLNLAHVVELRLKPVSWRQAAAEPLVE